MHGANWEPPRSPNGANHAIPEKLLGEPALFLFCLPYLQAPSLSNSQTAPGASSEGRPGNALNLDAGACATIPAQLRMMKTAVRSAIGPGALTAPADLQFY